MTERIFITGDKHGTFLPFFGIVENNDINESDIIIIAGDAGYVWDENYMYKIDTLQQIFPGTIAFIDGNHENHDLLEKMEVSQWNGGKVHKMGERVFHLMRGEIYSIYGNNFFTLGGARSVDKDRRTEGESWWKNEEPDADEILYARERFEENLNNIDYVITHETPLFARGEIARDKPIDDDYMLPKELEKWYDMIISGERFKKWYFGHMHVDQVITSTLRGLHTDILTIGSEEAVKWG